MKGWLKARRERIDALALRERMLVFVALLAGAWWGWDHLLMTPLNARRAALEVSVPKLRHEIVELHRQSRELALARSRDPDAPARRQLARLRVENQRVEQVLAAFAERLVPPADMGRVLEAVLDRQHGLRLQRLEGLGPEALLPAAVPADTDVPAGAGALPGNVFRHGLRMTFTGGYLDTLAYLQALEELPWNFLWGEIRLQVGQYPDAEVTLTVYSLSFDEAWIGA